MEGEGLIVLPQAASRGQAHALGRCHVTDDTLFPPPQGVLYVGTSEGVAAVPVARCSVYTTCSQCVLARDPLCGWSRAGGVCTSWEGPADNM